MPKYCKPCAVIITTKNKKRREETGVLLRKGRPRLGTTLPMVGAKVCVRCLEEKPVNEFPATGKGCRWRRGHCRACGSLESKQWRAENPDKVKAVSKHTNQRLKALRAAFKQWRGRSPEEIDAARKALSDNPPGAESEGELLAYYRGFISGAKRGQDESERFGRYQDIAFRVAAELAGKQRGVDPSNSLTYEDMVSVGYEAVLEVLRKTKEPERAVVAQAIRHRIVDELRRRFGATSRAGGKARLVTGAFEDEDGPTGLLESLEARGGAEEASDLWERVQGLVAEASGVDERLEGILRARVEGKTLLEISRELGLTESRVCQILKEARPWLEEHILPLAVVA